MLHRGGGLNSISAGHIERGTLVDVQVMMMRRTGIIVGSLLPVLWLLATGDSCLELMGDCGGGCCVASILAAQHGNRLPIQSSDGSFEKSARSWNRRPWIHSGPDGFLPFVTATHAELPVYSQVATLVSFSGVPLHLAKTWQFSWRTALEPRAPSLVS